MVDQARALLQAAIEFGKDRGGIGFVQLEVIDGNTPALSLYESFGFQSYVVEPMAVLKPTGFKSKVHMWLDLSSTADAGWPCAQSVASRRMGPS
jgi:GNAT superfamily N-acetyltransferase